MKINPYVIVVYRESAKECDELFAEVYDRMNKRSKECNMVAIKSFANGMIHVDKLVTFIFRSGDVRHSSGMTWTWFNYDSTDDSLRYFEARGGERIIDIYQFCDDVVNAIDESKRFMREHPFEKYLEEIGEDIARGFAEGVDSVKSE